MPAFLSHRVVEVGWDLWRLSSPDPLLKARLVGAGAQGGELGFGYFQG